MTREEQLKKYRKEMKRWKDKYLQLRRELLCSHEWEKIKTVFRKERGGSGGNLEISYRCNKCGKEKIIKMEVGKIHGRSNLYL